MDTTLALAMGRVNRDRPSMVFDWKKAAGIIRDRLILGSIKEASAGLREDWKWTGGKIFDNGAVVPKEKTYTYLASTWAVPELKIDGELFDCYVMKDENLKWDSDTYWPQEALEILNEAGVEQ